MNKKETLYNHLKEIPDFLLFASKCLSCYLPVVGEVITYREFRSDEAVEPVPRKYAALIALGLGAMKAPLFISPCEETLALYTVSGWSELFGKALSESYKKDKKKIN